MNPRIKNLLAAFVVTLVVIGAGAVEDWYGRFDYGPDAIAYLEISKAISHGDWTLALSPYWSIGYPLVLSAMRWMFPAGPQGEWIAVHVVNLVIFLATYLSFLHFLRVASNYTARVNGAENAGAGYGFVFTIGVAVFLLVQFLVRSVSRVGPDFLVSCLFFLAMALALQFCLRPRAKTAVLLGLIIGFGYLVKAIFLSISVPLLLVVFLHSLTRSSTERLPAFSKLALVLPAMLLLAVPYIAGMSVALGSFTLGESGSLNYAWNVNGLPHWDDWQGGPSPFGAPIHPTHLVLKNPPVFEFAEPYHVTFPPWFNPYYWYEGYHPYFSLKNQAFALVSNSLSLRRLIFTGPRAVLEILATTAFIAVGIILLKERRVWWKRLVGCWPVYLPSIAAIGIYLLVVVQPRYLAAFEIILLTFPFVPLFVPTLLFSKKAGYVLAFLIVGVAASILANDQGYVFERALHHRSYANEEQWRIADYLTRMGIQPGDKAASVGIENGSYCTWAYVSGVHIVAEIGNDAYDPKDQEKDFELFTSSPQVQQTVFDAFKQAGAVVVVLLDVYGPIQGPGWERIPGTQSWVHRI